MTTPTFQPPVAAPPSSLGDLYASLPNTHPDRLGVGRAIEALRATATAREAHIVQLLADHRRLRNVRDCSGCDWQPAHPGSTSDPADTARRHADFNAHLAALIVDGLS